MIKLKFPLHLTFWFMFVNKLSMRTLSQIYWVYKNIHHWCRDIALIDYVLLRKWKLLHNVTPFLKNTKDYRML